MIQPEEAWPLASSGGGLRPGELALWRFSLGKPSAKEWDLLSPDERARAERLIVPSKRDQLVVGRATMRRLLGACVERDPAMLRFEYGEHDKPRLVGYPGLAFNLSHSGEMALLGVSLEPGRLGVDVEWARSGRDFLGIAENFFSAPERAYLRSLAGCEERGVGVAAEVEAAFYRAWTRKEAYLKALGTGLTFASSRFTVIYARGEKARVVATEAPGDDPDRWRMIDLAVAEGYAGACCWEGGPRSVQRYTFLRA